MIDDDESETYVREEKRRNVRERQMASPNIICVQIIENSKRIDEESTPISHKI